MPHKAEMLKAVADRYTEKFGEVDEVVLDECPLCGTALCGTELSVSETPEEKKLRLVGEIYACIKDVQRGE